MQKYFSSLLLSRTQTFEKLNADPKQEMGWQNLYPSSEPGLKSAEISMPFKTFR